MFCHCDSMSIYVSIMNWCVGHLTCRGDKLCFLALFIYLFLRIWYKKRKRKNRISLVIAIKICMNNLFSSTASCSIKASIDRVVDSAFKDTAYNYQSMHQNSALRSSWIQRPWFFLTKTVPKSNLV